MAQRIVRIAPIQAGKVFAMLYGIMSLFILPIFMLPSLLGAKNAPPVWLPLLLVPIYVLSGFLMTAAMAWLYNLIAGWIGGIEITIESDKAE